MVVVLIIIWGGRILARTLFAPTLFALACSLALSRQRELVRLRDELGELQRGEHQATRAEQAQLEARHGTSPFSACCERTRDM